MTSEPPDQDGQMDLSTPPSAHASHWKRWCGVGVAIFAILFIADRYLARHRQVFVVNGFPQSLTLGLPGGKVEVVGAEGRTLITIPEGQQQIKVEGPINEIALANVARSIPDRWFGQTDWFLNPGGAALLLYERQTRTNAGSVSVESKLLYDNSFFGLPKVDFLFAEFPRGAQPEPGDTLTRLERIPIAEAVNVLLNTASQEDALQLLEWRLRLEPRETLLLMPYVGLSLASNHAKQARKFLEWGTTLRPLLLQWHRFYQDVSLHAGEQAPLTARYDRLLEQDPTNSALIYLRGRLCIYRHEALPFYERALREDPSNAFAHNGVAFLHAATGDWATALRHSSRAVELDPEDRQMQELLFDSQLAAGSLDELEARWRGAVQTNASQLLPRFRLAAVLAAQGRANELNQLAQPFNEAAAMGGLRARHEAAQLMYQVAYLKGDFPALLGLVKNNIDLFGLPEQFQTLLAAGQLEQIDKMVQPKAAPQLDPLHLLIVGLAWEIAREPGRAKPWREEAIRRLRLERPEYAVAADMLEHPNETALTDVIDLAIAPQAKAILLVALAQGHSSQAAAMRRAARDLNVRREFPFHWIDRLSAP